jgi:hypothetical protein
MRKYLVAVIVAVVIACPAYPADAAVWGRKTFCEAAWSANTWWGDIIAAINGC